MLRRELLTAAALSCLPSGIPRAARASTPGRMTFSWASNAGPLHPHLYSPNQMYAQAMLYEPLVRYAEGGRIAPALATGWRQEEDGCAWVFTLRPGVRFHDGAPFDAAAVVANVQAVLANRERHAWLDPAARRAGAAQKRAGSGVRLLLHRHGRAAEVAGRGDPGRPGPRRHRRAPGGRGRGHLLRPAEVGRVRDDLQRHLGGALRSPRLHGFHAAAVARGLPGAARPADEGRDRPPHRRGLASTDEALRASEYRWLLTTLHEQAVYLPVSFLTNKVVHPVSLAPVPFGDTQYEIPFDRIG